MFFNDFEYQLIPGGAQITGYRGTLGKVTFPDEIDGQPLVSLARCAFVTNPYLTEVTVPDTVREIGFGAFEGCLNLRSINLPTSLVKLGFRAFARCENLEEAIIPQGITELEEGVYNGCAALHTLKLPVGLKVIARNACLGCNALTEIVVPEGVERIGVQAFSGCGSLAVLTLPASVIEIGSDAIQGCGLLEDIRVPEIYQPHVRDLRVGYGLMLQDGAPIVGSFTYMKLRGQAILEDYEGPSHSLTIPAQIEGYPVGGISHMLFMNLPSLETISLPGHLRGVEDIVPFGVKIIYRD